MVARARGCHSQNRASVLDCRSGGGGGGKEKHTTPKIEHECSIRGGGGGGRKKMTATSEIEHPYSILGVVEVVFISSRIVF